LQVDKGESTVSTRDFQGPLRGIRVIDLTRVYAGPLCTQTLADQGADVIKVEPPVGDETRNWGTKLDEDRSTYFNGLNRNKRSVALDLSKEAGREALLKLLDVFETDEHLMLVTELMTGGARPKRKVQKKKTSCHSMRERG